MQLCSLNRSWSNAWRLCNTGDDSRKWQVAEFSSRGDSSRTLSQHVQASLPILTTEVICSMAEPITISPSQLVDALGGMGGGEAIISASLAAVLRSILHQFKGSTSALLLIALIAASPREARSLMSWILSNSSSYDPSLRSLMSLNSAREVICCALVLFRRTLATGTSLPHPQDPSLNLKLSAARQASELNHAVLNSFLMFEDNETQKALALVQRCLDWSIPEPSRSIQVDKPMSPQQVKIIQTAISFKTTREGQRGIV